MSFTISYLFRYSLNLVKRFRVSNKSVHDTVFRNSLPCTIQNFASVTKYQHIDFTHSRSPFLALSILGWLGLEKPTESIEDELITNIKWGILLLQRKDYKKSEKMFHLALRMAQQLQNQKAVTYIYDMMANLAMETEQFEKAEKLFISVMERLLGNGYQENHIKNLHVSLKISRCNHLNGNLEKASIGYRWVISNLEKNASDDVMSASNKLLAIAKDWYGHCLYDQNEFSEAMKTMTDAFYLLKQLNNEEDLEELICLINDIGTIYEQVNDLDNAEKYLKEAIRITRDRTDDTANLGVLYVNLGRVFIRKQANDKAHKCCSRGLKFAIAAKSEECLKEAKACLEDIKKSRK